MTTTRSPPDRRRAPRGRPRSPRRTSSRGKGLHGASTDDIARAAGISQPYLFRLFGTKKELYLATARRTVDHLYEVFAEAARGKTGMDGAPRDGRRLRDRDGRPRPADADAEVLGLVRRPGDLRGVRRAWRDLVDLAERASGESPEAVSTFFSKGALLTVLMAMDAFTRPEPWSNRLIEGCQTGMTE